MSKTLFLFTYCAKCGKNNDKIFREEKPIKTQITDLIDNINK